jgi:hypothetical protein
VPFELGLNRRWYIKGRVAARSGKYADETKAWKAAKGKPRIPGARVTAQESFYQGWLDVPEQRNPRWTRVSIPNAQIRVNAAGRIQVKIPLKQNPKLGTGERFVQCVQEVTARGGARDPRAVCAKAGRAKYGKRRFQKLARAGKRRAARRR